MQEKIADESTARLLRTLLGAPQERPTRGLRRESGEPNKDDVTMEA